LLNKFNVVKLTLSQFEDTMY